MIKRLSRQIFITIVVILSLVMACILIVLNVYNWQQDLSNAYSSMYRIISSSEKNDHAGPIGNNNTKPQNNFVTFSYDTDFFIAFFNDDMELLEIAGNELNNFTEDELVDIAKELVTPFEVSGRTHHMLYTVSIKKNIKTVMFISDFHLHDNSIKMIIASVIAFILGTAIFCIVALYLTKRIVKPVSEGFEKQKQFISDASHELKTPITVIQSNAELLESQIEENKWLTYILTETRRMKTLLESLLTLSRIENDSAKKQMTSFDISTAILGTALPFEGIAFEKQIQYDMDIDSNISYIGNETEIKQLAAILLDNAMKHTTVNGQTKISLKSIHSSKNFSKKHIELRVENTGDEIPENEREKIFERFYRLDKARNRAGGRYGLGLAIAKAIVENHHGKISVECSRGMTKFIVIF